MIIGKLGIKLTKKTVKPASTAPKTTRSELNGLAIKFLVKILFFQLHYFFLLEI